MLNARVMDDGNGRLRIDRLKGRGEDVRKQRTRLEQHVRKYARGKSVRARLHGELRLFVELPLVPLNRHPGRLLGGLNRPIAKEQGPYRE